MTLGMQPFVGRIPAYD